MGNVEAGQLINKGPLGENPLKKRKEWYGRDSYIIRGTTPPSGWIQESRLRETNIKYQWEEVIPGEKGVPFVRCKTFRFFDADPAEEDGAEVAIQAGKMTPVQHVSSQTAFSETPLRGQLILLYVNSDGEFSTYYFNVPESQDGKHKATIHQGEIMSWYACKDNRQDALVLETEIPGFSEATLPTIDDGVTNFNGTPIPEEFWNTVELLRNGLEEDVLPQCVNVA